MRHAIPPMHAEVAALNERRHHAHDGQKQPRWHMRYRLATGPAQDRQGVARLLGVPRPPWAAGWPSLPLEGSMADWPPMFRPVTPSPARPRSSPAWRKPCAVRKASPRLKPCANGCGGRMAWRATTTRGIPSCARGSGPSATGHAPVTPNNPEAMPAFQATCQERRQRVIPPTHTRPVRVCSQDDSCVGWLTVRRRRLTASGVQPVGTVQHVCAWCDVYGAVAPITGERFCFERPSLTAETVQIFIDTFAAAFPERLTLLRLDHRGNPPRRGSGGRRRSAPWGCHPMASS